jgi:hypothetical protein
MTFDKTLNSIIQVFLNSNRSNSLALPQFFLLFAIGLDKPLSKASSGQASDG